MSTGRERPVTFIPFHMLVQFVCIFQNAALNNVIVSIDNRMLLVYRNQMNHEV